MTAILSFLKPEKPRTLDCVRFLRRRAEPRR